MLKPRSARTIGDLRKDLRTLHYEIWMLCGAAERLQLRRKDHDNVAFNALLEAFALHCRNLIHFFHCDATTSAGKLLFRVPHDTDVIFDDFFRLSGGVWAKRPAITKLLIRAKHQADKQIAHITVDRRPLNRKNAAGKKWHFASIARQLSQRMKLFLDEAPSIDPVIARKIRAALWPTK
ncbi:MAG: hypothetical protein HYS13_20525 [Planctomycetia bacterium]|nr:hypothetical protein [Planctomycetia bacterium]